MRAAAKYNARRDANEQGIVDALRAAGCKVERSDFIDLIVQRPDGKWIGLEVKTPTGRLTKKQERYLAEGWLFRVVRSVDEALEAIADEEFVA